MGSKMKAGWGMALALVATGVPASTAAAAGIPDFTGQWGRNVLYFEPPPSGPGPVNNRSLKPNGAMDGSALVGDYTDPILKPAASDTIRKLGEISLKGIAFANPHNQCRPEPT